MDFNEELGTLVFSKHTLSSTSAMPSRRTTPATLSILDSRATVATVEGTRRFRTRDVK